MDNRLDLNYGSRARLSRRHRDHRKFIMRFTRLIPIVHIATAGSMSAQTLVRSTARVAPPPHASTPVANDCARGPPPDMINPHDAPRPGLNWARAYEHPFFNNGESP